MRFANRQGPAGATKDDIGGGEVTVVTGREESKTADNAGRTSVRGNNNGAVNLSLF